MTATFLDWSKQHVFRPQKPTIFEQNPDPNVCECGLDKDHPEHVPPPPKVDSEAFLRRKRIKEFLDRHGAWRGEQRVLPGRNGGRSITYTHAGVDEVPDEQLAQEMIDILCAHADQSRCGNANKPGCGAVIWWIENPSTGKKVSYQGDGQIHYAACKVWQQMKKKGA